MPEKNSAPARAPKKLGRSGIILLPILIFSALPFFIESRVYALHLLSMIYLNIIILMGLVIILGYTKQFSLGQVAFYGIGAYTTAILTAKLHLNFFLVMGISGLVAAGAAALVAVPATRFQGPWLALVTFAFAEIARILMIRLKGLTGGFGGFFNIPKPSIGGFIFDNTFKYYFIAFGTMIAVLWITYRVRRSALGSIWVSLGDNEDLSSSLGINAFYQKILAFSVGSFFAGIAGSIYAGYASFISPENFTIRHTIYYLSILIVGGLESISGAIAATVIFTLFSSYLMALYPWDMVIFGAIIVLFVNLVPEGIGAHFVSLGKRLRIM